MLILNKYERTCDKCPAETICWKPELLEDPIPIENIETFIDMHVDQMFSLILKQKFRQLLVFSGEKRVCKTFKVSDRKLKIVIRDIFQSISTHIAYTQDPVFSYFISTNKLPDMELQLVGVTETPPITTTFKYGNTKLENCLLLTIQGENMVFYKIDPKNWNWVPEIVKKTIEISASGAAREAQKRQEEEEEVFFLEMRK